MIRGTTPTYDFEIPFDTGLLEDAFVVFVQQGKEILRKTIQDATLTNNVITFKLSQDETFRFDEHASIRIQLRVLTEDGESFVSPIMVDRMGVTLSEDVI